LQMTSSTSKSSEVQPVVSVVLFLSTMLVVLMAGQTVKWGISPIHVWTNAISVSFIQCYPTITINNNHIYKLVRAFTNFPHV
jgi:hypothetical protein